MAYCGTLVSNRSAASKAQGMVMRVGAIHDRKCGSRQSKKKADKADKAPIKHGNQLFWDEMRGHSGCINHGHG